MKQLLFKIILGYLVVMALEPAITNADRGGFALGKTERVTLEEPGQKAIIAYNGAEEVLILGTDVKASQPTTVLEFIPFPTEPTVSLAPDSFKNLEKLLQTYGLRYTYFAIAQDANTRSESGRSEGVEVRFHDQLGLHDVTVVHIRDAADFTRWINEFFKAHGFPERTLTSEESTVINDYLQRGCNFFVFDVVEMGPTTSSIEPLVYQFRTSALYYPLETSRLFHGEGTIEFFLFAESAFVIDRFDWYMKEIAYARNKPGEHLLQIDFETPRQLRDSSFPWLSSNTVMATMADLQSIAPQLPQLFKKPPFFRTFRYHGDLQFYQDIWIKPVVPWESSGLPTIEIMLDTNQAQYQVGDQFELQFIVDQDCYCSLINGISDGTILVLPDSFLGEDKIKTGRIYSLWDDFDLHLKISPPAGIEMITLFCSAEKHPLAPSDFTQRTWCEIPPMPTKQGAVKEQEAILEQRNTLLERLYELQQGTWGAKSVFVSIGDVPIDAAPQQVGAMLPIGTTHAPNQPSGMTGTTEKR